MGSWGEWIREHRFKLGNYIVQLIRSRSDLESRGFADKLNFLLALIEWTAKLKVDKLFDFSEMRFSWVSQQKHNLIVKFVFNPIY